MWVSPSDLPVSVRPSPVSDARVESRGGVLLWALMGLTLLPRALAYCFNQNLYGDAVVRTELAQQWLQSPHWISSFADGAQQFGPLHLYLVALSLWLWPSAEDAGRLLSLVLGVATTVPLFYLTQRLFNRRAAVWACTAFAFWGLHIQMSTTAGSEALSLFLVLWALVFYERSRTLRELTPLWAAALCMNLACATRYDVWLLIPLLCVGFFIQTKDRVAAATLAVVFGLACLPFPLVWMYGNETALGSAFAPLHFIDEFHRTWSISNVAHWGAPFASVQGLLFWPATALTTLSPLVGFFGMWGLARSYKLRPDLRWLFWLVMVPTLYFSVRGAVLNFVPLARFAVNQVALVLPFVHEGFNDLLAPGRRALRGAVAGLTALVALALPTAVAAATYQQESPVRNALRPISPVTTNPPDVIAAAHWMKANLGEDSGRVLIDGDEAYSDLQIIFFSQLPDAHWIRRRWPDQMKRRVKYPPQYVLLLPDGWLSHDPDVQIREDRVDVAGVRYTRVAAFPKGPQRLYERAAFVTGP